MANNNLTLDLKSRKDKDGNTFYVAKLKGPFSIDCKDGLVLLVFVSDLGDEQIQLTSMDTKNQDD